MENTQKLNEMKKKSLVKMFIIVFALFALGTILVNGTMTYIAQTESYHSECVTDLRRITTHLVNQIQSEGDEFIYLKAWFQEHPDLVQVPVDFKSDLPVSKSAFDDYILENYPGKDYGTTLFFNDLDLEGQRLYVNYAFERWFTLFFEATDSFDLMYTYFIYPESEKDLKMNYMFDPTMETKTAPDGREILKLGEVVYEDPEIHQTMWDTWFTGRAQNGFDIMNNEFGQQYNYCAPVVINGEKVGLLCSEISVAVVNSEIMKNVIIQGLVSAVVLIIFTAILYLLLSKNVLHRIIGIEREVREYSEKKDPEIAKDILSHVKIMDEIGMLAKSFGEMITELEDYMVNLQKVTAEKERIDADLSIASQIQADMLPKIFPPFPDREELDIYATMTPAKEVGGDFYDFFLVDENHIALVIADVSGKGVPASLFMVIAKTLIKNRLQMGEEPGEALYNVNNQLCEGNDAELFVTVWAVVIDLTTGDALEANAGHEYPAFRRGNGSYELIKTKHSPAVATMEGLKFRQSEFHLDPGDRLFVYTDGVTEATDANLELFGEQRLIDALNRNPDASPTELLPAVKKEIDEFVGEAPQFDDITMLSFIYRGKA
ncbi:SpoIIE family protein phosphatase [Butyrivibrio sp. INlla16]|uniref:SpoIIE family protein phosphatase n=1 Tax=Butyrivibrio sp. INlla16 TaxID=1520807 RepID=UPI00088D4F13|nr:SpoIIE family protein phosphatase [Butyrivibrio sp. INlla16]SDB24500.1 Stage II sporulation protein E (SpoIIE) [Butyrivibrio sp. INlla16]